MTDRPPEVEIDTTVPNAARVYDYLLGGTTNFAVDREAAERNNAVLPGGTDAARGEVRANRAFLGRVVRYLGAEAGIRQFLDIGTGIPNEDNVHSVVEQVAPDSRVVCVDYDPVVLAHAHELLTTTPEGVRAYVHGDIRQPDEILTQAAETLDLDQPVALMLLGILYLLRDEEDPYGIVARLMEPLAPGSYLAASHITADFNPEMAQLVERLNASMAEPFTLRTETEVTRFFEGLEIIEPGVVQVDQWPEPQPVPTDRPVTAYYAGVARKA